MRKFTSSENPSMWIESVIGDFVGQSPENSMNPPGAEKLFEDCLVGYAAGKDPLFSAFKHHVGPFHWTPREVFELAFPGSGARAADLTVISWVLPQTEKTRADNRRETRFPSERWAKTRVFGESFNGALRRHVIAQLGGAGYRAVAPMLSPSWERKTSDRFGYSSTWSERHAAYAAGLGTFGLCDGLITPRGKAVRLGSVVAEIHIPHTERPYTDHHQHCLFFSRGTCGKCIKRCHESENEPGKIAPGVNTACTDSPISWHALQKIAPLPAFRRRR
jgi:hypothetical protein